MSPLQQLLQAKAESDRKNFTRKRQILQHLIQQAPGDFLVDQPHAIYPGITHTPTNFRLHVPRELAQLIPQKAASALGILGAALQ